MEDRLGGHVVLGHVDAVGRVVAPAPDLRVQIPAALMRYCVEKGSIAVDGISLTIFDLDDETFRVAVIPHTAAVTTLGSKGPGAPVNIEVDVMAKHVEKLLQAPPSRRRAVKHQRGRGPRHHGGHRRPVPAARAGRAGRCGPCCRRSSAWAASCSCGSCS